MRLAPLDTADAHLCYLSGVNIHVQGMCAVLLAICYVYAADDDSARRSAVVRYSISAFFSSSGPTLSVNREHMD